MISINVGSVPAEFPQQREMIADCGAQGPMSQQDAVGSHGHEMYPQKFVLLVGCHDPRAGRHEGASSALDLRSACSLSGDGPVRLPRWAGER